jgi:hypothetical protein
MNNRSGKGEDANRRERVKEGSKEDECGLVYFLLRTYIDYLNLIAVTIRRD